MRAVLIGTIFARQTAEGRIEVAVHFDAKGHPTFHRARPDGPMGGNQAVRAVQALQKACQDFGIAVDPSTLVEHLSFADLLADPTTCAEHYLALVGRDVVFGMNSDTKWLSIDGMAELKWLRYRLMLVRQVATVLRCIEDHYTTMSKLATATPEELEAIAKIRDAQETSKVAREIADDAGRQDLLFGVTVASMRCNTPVDPEWNNANGVNWLLDADHKKAQTVNAVLALAIKRRAIDHALLVPWPYGRYRDVHDQLCEFAQLHTGTLGSEPFKYLANAWYTIAERLSQT